MKKYYYLVGCVLLFVISWIVYQFYFIEITDSKWQIIKNSDETDGKAALFCRSYLDEKYPQDIDAWNFNKKKFGYIDFRDRKYYVYIDDKIIYDGEYNIINSNTIFLKPNLSAECFSSNKFKDTILIKRGFNEIELVSKPYLIHLKKL